MKTLSKFICVAVIFLSFLLSWPQSSLAASLCPEDGQTMSKVELYFGLDIPGGGKVKPTEWQSFIDNEITPRFPDGLTIDTVSGQWRDAQTNKTIQEESRMVMILYTPSAEAEEAIEDIRNTYKSKFQQDSVMRLDESNCVSF
ncbi:MAG: DUF3574 domain-containing protein [Crocosphaera sp.]|nr:DUF3574 domain-containing protein [Crocosphaera sp.]